MNKKFHLIFLVTTTLLLFISQLILNNFKVEIDTLTYYLRGMLLIVTVEAILLGRNSVNKKVIYSLLVIAIISLLIFAMQFYQVDIVSDLLLLLFIIAVVFIILGISEQIEENKKVKNKLEKMAYYDALTGLPTRNFLLKNNGNDKLNINKDLTYDIEHIFKDSKHSALLFLDIDDFKLVNDYLGHYNGDQLLKKVAIRLKNLIQSDDLIIHLSGDEFVVIINNIDEKESINQTANKIIYSVNEAFNIGEKVVYISCSLGVSIYPDHGINIDNLLKKADIAMYEAKKKGKNNFLIFEPDFNMYFSNRYVLVDELKNAIANNDFLAYYQPKVSIKDNKVFSYEALARWRHPKDGLISPNLFIGAAEELKMIDLIDRLMIRNVCNDLNKLKEKNIKPFPVSINISPLFFNDASFCKTLFSIIDEFNLDPSLFTIEITESIAIYDFEDTIIKIKNLKSRNIKIAIDDFGKGYSSLTYIKLLPIDYLKIDKTFIDGILNNKIDEAIVRYSIEISNLLGIKTIAEGVETKEQLDYLTSLGCNAYQGYFYSKPIPFEELKTQP